MIFMKYILLDLGNFSVMYLLFSQVKVKQAKLGFRIAILA